MMKVTAKSMAACVMAFLLLCGCSHKRDESVNTQQDLGNDFFASESAANDTCAESGPDTAKYGTENPDASGDESQKEAGQIFIYVCGAVKEPGVYVLPEGSRVYEAISMAGGMTPEANTEFVNQARVLVDGEQITVYTKEETEGLTADTFAYDSPAGEMSVSQSKININTATAEELTTLSGIGEARAEAIIEYRETNGAFRDTTDIMKISGIGEALYDKIKDDIVVS